MTAKKPSRYTQALEYMAEVEAKHRAAMKRGERASLTNYPKLKAWLKKVGAVPQSGWATTRRLHDKDFERIQVWSLNGRSFIVMIRAYRLGSYVLTDRPDLEPKDYYKDAEQRIKEA